MRPLTLARDLRRRKARERDHLFVAEGIRSVEELLRSPLTVRGLLAAPKLVETPRGVALRERAVARGVEVVDVSERDFQSAADTDSPQGVLAVAEIPSHTLGEFGGGPSTRLLILDAVQDPGNVGTLVRTAAALGADAIVALEGTVDLWNAKVVRSAMGAHFRHPALHASWEAVEAFLTARGIALWIADAAGAAIDARPAPAHLALAVGNEGAGLTPAVIARAEHSVAIPIAADIESLNVAVAAGILLHALRP